MENSAQRNKKQETVLKEMERTKKKQAQRNKTWVVFREKETVLKKEEKMFKEIGNNPEWNTKWHSKKQETRTLNRWNETTTMPNETR